MTKLVIEPLMSGRFLPMQVDARGMGANRKAAVTSLFAEARMGRAIDAATCLPLVNDVVGSVDRNSDALISLCRLKLADEYFSTKSGMPLLPRLVDLSESHVTDKIVAREPPENWSFGYLNDLWATHIA